MDLIQLTFLRDNAGWDLMVREGFSGSSMCEAVAAEPPTLHRLLRNSSQARWWCPQNRKRACVWISLLVCVCERERKMRVGLCLGRSCLGLFCTWTPQEFAMECVPGPNGTLELLMFCHVWQWNRPYQAGSVPGFQHFTHFNFSQQGLPMNFLSHHMSFI